MMDLHRNLVFLTSVFMLLCSKQVVGTVSILKQMEECAAHPLTEYNSRTAISEIACAIQCEFESECQIHFFNQTTGECRMSSVPEILILELTGCETNMTVRVDSEYEERFDSMKKLIEIELDVCFIDNMTNSLTHLVNNFDECTKKCKASNCQMFAFDQETSQCKAGSMPVTEDLSFCSFDCAHKKLKAYIEVEVYNATKIRKCSEMWLDIQRRSDGSQPFDKTWIDYKNGFGDLNGEFWLGNEKLHELTNAGSMKIRFDLWDKDDNHTYAEYSQFSVGQESDNYRLKISGYRGTAGNSMNYYHNRFAFSTKDRDNDDNNDGSCSQEHGYAGWWFSDCRTANLNGQYVTPGTIVSNNICWMEFRDRESLKKTVMKIAYN